MHALMIVFYDERLGLESEHQVRLFPDRESALKHACDLIADSMDEDGFWKSPDGNYVCGSSVVSPEEFLEAFQDTLESAEVFHITDKVTSITPKPAEAPNEKLLRRLRAAVTVESSGKGFNDWAVKSVADGSTNPAMVVVAVDRDDADNHLSTDWDVGHSTPIRLVFELADYAQETGLATYKVTVF